MKTRWFLEDIITSSNAVFKDIESNIVLSYRNLGNPTRKVTESNDTVKQTVGS